MDAQFRAYFERLLQRASLHDVEEMSRRVAEVAAQRYWKEN